MTRETLIDLKKRDKSKNEMPNLKITKDVRSATQNCRLRTHRTTKKNIP